MDVRVAKKQSDGDFFNIDGMKLLSRLCCEQTHIAYRKSMGQRRAATCNHLFHSSIAFVYINSCLHRTKNTELSLFHDSLVFWFVAL